MKKRLLILSTMCAVLSGLTALAVAGVGGAASSATCGKRANVNFLFETSHVLPSAGTTLPNGCWGWSELKGGSAAYRICSAQNYPSISFSGPTGDPFIYDDTNPGHTQSPGENSVIKNTCLGGGSSLSIEFEAQGGCGAANWTARNTGFSVGSYQKELYCSPDTTTRDDVACPGESSTIGCVVNVGPIWDSLSNLEHDLATACSQLQTGWTMTVYANHPSASETAAEAGNINAALNNCIF